MQGPNRSILSIVTDLSLSLEPSVGDVQRMTAIVEGVVGAIAVADSASVSTQEAGKIVPLAQTDDLAVQADAAQSRSGSGPSIDATWDRTMVVAHWLETDSRWKRYGAEATALGVASQLAIGLGPEPHTLGVLSVYSKNSNVFDRSSVELTRLFANHAAVGLGWSRREQSLNEALRTRATIGQAVGIVMERYKLDSHRAFEYLRRLSCDGNIKLRDVARELVRRVEGTTPAATMPKTGSLGNVTGDRQRI